MTISDQPRLPGLSAADTRWLVQEAHRVLRDLGWPATIMDGTWLKTEAGANVGLENMARTLHLLPRRRWGRVVREQLTALTSADPRNPVPEEDLRAKLWQQDRADAILQYEPLTPLPGLVAVLAAQGKGTTMEFGRLDGIGDREAAYTTALANLSALRLPTHTRRRVDTTNPTSWVDFLGGDDSFVAARVLVLPDMVRRVLRQDFPASGVLVAVPTKYDLWLHVPVDETVVHTAARMAWLAHETWRQEPYALSPDVFLVSPDMAAVQLVMPDRDGVDLNPGAMARLLHALPTADEREAG